VEWTSEIGHRLKVKHLMKKVVAHFFSNIWEYQFCGFKNWCQNEEILQELGENWSLLDDLLRRVNKKFQNHEFGK